MYVLHADMGLVRAGDRRAGIRREGPAERVRIEVAQQRARERQRESRRRRRETANRCVGSTVDEGCTSEADSAYPDGVNRRLVRRDVASILSCVHRTLGGRGRFLPHKQAVMRSVLNSPITKDILPPETRKVSAETEARERIVSSLLQSLSEVKTSKTRAHLATKHAILTAAVTNGLGVCARQTARLLGVHHRNVAMATQRRASMLTEDHMEWTLSVRKTRSDATSGVVQDIVTAWWAAETRPSPNRKEVVRKWVAPKTYVQHHAQYLLESLVSVRISMHSTSILRDAPSALTYIHSLQSSFFLWTIPHVRWVFFWVSRV
jgi:hypothetical protein